MKVSKLFVYPIKSVGGVSLSSAEITDRGLKYDRRWMLVDESNTFISQRKVPQLALLRIVLAEKGMKVFHVSNPLNSILVPYESKGGSKDLVQIWDDACEALHIDPTIDEWFASQLSMSCRLMFMPDESHRFVTPPHRNNREINSFSDSYPFLLIGERSLEDLNKRIGKPLPMNRFRPNIVFSGGEPYQEDKMAHFTIRNLNFYGVKLSARCNLTTIDQQDATIGKEPLKTLAGYRKANNKIYFGQNLIHEGQGTINVGDIIAIREIKESIFDDLLSSSNE